MKTYPQATISLFDCTNFSDFVYTKEGTRQLMLVSEALRRVCPTEINGHRHNVMVTVRPDGLYKYKKAVRSLECIKRSGANLTAFVSMGSMNSETEACGLRWRIRFLKECAETGIYAVPYFKPLVKEWFDFEKSRWYLERILEHADCVVVGGLKLDIPIINNLLRKGIEIPEHSFKEGEAYINREFLDEFFPRLLGIHLHDIMGRTDDHRAPYSGTFRFDMLVPYMSRDTIKVIEVHAPAQPEAIRRGHERLKTVLPDIEA